MTTKVIYVIGKVLSGELSCMQIGLVMLCAHLVIMLDFVVRNMKIIKNFMRFHSFEDLRLGYS